MCLKCWNVWRLKVAVLSVLYWSLDKKIKLTNGTWRLAKFKSTLRAEDVGPAWIEGWLQVVAHQLNIFIRKYKMKVCSNRTTSNGNGWQQQQKQRSKNAMSSGCCGSCCLTDGSFLIVYTVWCAWFVLTFWRTYCLHLRADIISFRWLFIWFGGRKYVGYIWWFEGNVANLSCGKEGIVFVVVWWELTVPKWSFLRASVSERYENSVTSERLTVLSGTLSSFGHHYFSILLHCLRRAELLCSWKLPAPSLS